MRILFLANDGGGLYNFRKELLETAVKNGHKVYISIPEGKYARDICNLGCRYVMCRCLERHGRNPVKDIGLWMYYRKLIDKVKPDIVLTYTIKPNIYGGMVCGMKGIPYIANITGLGMSIENEGALRKITLALYRRGLRNARKVFFQNSTNKDFMVEHGVVKGNYEILPGSGVNLERHCFEDYPKDNGEIVFTTIGRIMRDKGIDEILLAARTVKSRYPFVRFRLVGSFEEAYQEVVGRAVKEGIVEYIQEQEDIHPFIKESHAVVHASYHEGMSNVLLESAATGRPVIASDIPGCREAFEDGVSGIGFAPRSAKALVTALEDFIRLPHEKKAKMGQAGRRKMEEEFDRRIVVGKYLDEINQAAKI